MLRSSYLRHILFGAFLLLAATACGGGGSDSGSDGDSSDQGSQNDNHDDSSNADSAAALAAARACAGTWTLIPTGPNDYLCPDTPSISIEDNGDTTITARGLFGHGSIDLEARETQAGSGIAFNAEQSVSHEGQDYGCAVACESTGVVTVMVLTCGDGGDSCSASYTR